MPDNGNYHEDKLNAFIDTAKIAEVPIYIGEWNNVKHDKSNYNDETKVIDGKRSDLSQKEADNFVQDFKKKMYGEQPIGVGTIYLIMHQILILYLWKRMEKV